MKLQNCSLCAGRVTGKSVPVHAKNVYGRVKL